MQSCLLFKWAFWNLFARIVCKYKCIVGVIWKASRNFLLWISSVLQNQHMCCPEVLRQEIFLVSLTFFISGTCHFSKADINTEFTKTTFFLHWFWGLLCKFWHPKRHLGTLALQWERLGLDPSSTVCDLEQVI